MNFKFHWIPPTHLFPFWFSFSEPVAAGQLPDEFDQREPIMFLPPFENSKDSPVLIAMQGEAQQAALLKTKTF